MSKEILVVCLPCGHKNDHKNKSVMGAWIDTCDICGEKDVPCASAPHDFGIYSSEALKIDDQVQDQI